VFVIILYSNRTGRPPPFPTAGPRQQEPSPIFALGGSRPPAFQFSATDIPSTSTLPMFQPNFDTTTEKHLGWDQMEFCDVLATLDSPQQAEEVGASQFTQAPLVLDSANTATGWSDLGSRRSNPSRRSDLGGRRSDTGGGGRATPVGRATPDVAGSSQATMATPSPDQLGPPVVKAPVPGRTTRTRPGLALELLGRKGADTFRCSTTFTMILYKLFPSTR
jgi:hypothetical protein